MSKRAIIPITNESAEGACTQYYEVRYRELGSEFWQAVTPNPAASPVAIEHLKDAQTYNVEIVRVCCNGEKSLPLLLTINTTETTGPDA